MSTSARVTHFYTPIRDHQLVMIYYSLKLIRLSYRIRVHSGPRPPTSSDLQQLEVDSIKLLNSCPLRLEATSTEFTWRFPLMSLKFKTHDLIKLQHKKMVKTFELARDINLCVVAQFRRVLLRVPQNSNSCCVQVPTILDK